MAVLGSRPMAFILAVALGAGVVVSYASCTGETSVEPVEEALITPESLSTTWALGYAKVEGWPQFQTPAWVEFVQARNLKAAASGFQGADAARAHAEAASMFRQAALLSANSAIETYEKTPFDTDPVGAAHLLTVAHALRGELDQAREASKRLDGVEDVTLPWHAPWKAWLSSGAVWPPDLTALPIELPPLEAGKWPEDLAAPHYKMPVRDAGDHAQAMGDPGVLVALAIWHDALAKKLSSPDEVDLYTARYRWPVEGPVTSKATLLPYFLYASDFLQPGDAAFMAAVMGPEGVAAVSANASTSILASLAQQSRVDGKINPEKAVDLAIAVRDGLVAASEAAAGKQEQHHRMFADIAYVGILRNLALIAERGGDQETGGKLRILAMESSEKHTGCSVALMSLAAWDAGNRYPSRAQEIVHRNAKFYPSLEAARFGLDVLALRVGREQVGTPGM